MGIIEQQDIATDTFCDLEIAATEAMQSAGVETFNDLPEQTKTDLIKLQERLFAERGVDRSQFIAEGFVAA
jgi:hypothetical protein